MYARKYTEIILDKYARYQISLTIIQNFIFIKELFHPCSIRKYKIFSQKIIVFLEQKLCKYFEMHLLNFKLIYIKKMKYFVLLYKIYMHDLIL